LWITALIPAGCDNTGDLVGRKPGWPWWQASANSTNEAQVRQTSRYFDAVNFAARVKCPALVGLGLIDTTSPPSGVFAAINQLQGTKEVVVLPNAEHMEHNHSQAPYYIRQNVWLKALLNGQPIPSK
jgi:cephalosporin-C deacetylase-like acetyl esterase